MRIINGGWGAPASVVGSPGLPTVLGNNNQTNGATIVSNLAGDASLTLSGAFATLSAATRTIIDSPGSVLINTATGSSVFDGTKIALQVGSGQWNILANGTVFDANQVILIDSQNFSFTINSAAGTALFDANGINLGGLPTTDPGVVGQVYSDGVPSAGNPKVLKISGG